MPDSPASAVPVVFIHGLWLHSTSWQPWVDVFTEAGYAPSAPEWPGVPDTVEEARAHPEAQDGVSLTDIVDHYAAVAAGLDQQPVFIGHSFGGLIAQILLGHGVGRAAVAVDPAPMKGVLPLPVSTLRSASPGLSKPGNRKKSVALTKDQFRYAFGNALSPAESDQLWLRWTIPSTMKPLFEGAFANFTPHSPARVATGNNTRGPLLLVSGSQDHTVAPVLVRSAAKLYKKSSAVTEFTSVDRGHSLTVDAGWREIAQISLDFLAKQGI
jgi:non-heme chloroperoxidase